MYGTDFMIVGSGYVSVIERRVLLHCGSYMFMDKRYLHGANISVEVYLHEVRFAINTIFVTNSTGYLKLISRCTELRARKISKSHFI